MLSVIGLASIVIATTVLAPNTNNQLALAQAQKTGNAITVNQTAAAKALNNFTASGQIGGSIPAVSSTSSNASQPSSTTTSANASSASALSYMLAGNWSMSVSKGNITNFKTSFVMVKTDGSGYHVHTISGFKVGNNTTFSLNPTGTSTINGTADVLLNGTIKWPGAHAKLSISKLTVIALTLSPSDTSNHFAGQPIYGAVTAMSSQNGTQIVGTSSNFVGSSTSSSGQGGLAGIFGNITKPLQNLFGGGKK